MSETNSVETNQVERIVMCDLDGHELNKAVAEALKCLTACDTDYIQIAFPIDSELKKRLHPDTKCMPFFKPSKYWKHGGELIENYHIELMLDRPTGLPKPKVGEGIWTAIINHELDGYWWAHGKTPLVAAMRVLVNANT